MIDPGYIPEDLSQYLLSYSVQEEEHNSCDDGQLNEGNSSDHESIFIPPYVSTPREPQGDQDSFDDSGMSEDESYADLPVPDSKAENDVHNAPNSEKLKSAKKSHKIQQKTAKTNKSTKSDKSKNALNQNIKKKSAKKSEKQPGKRSKAPTGSCLTEKKSAKSSSASKESKNKSDTELTTEDMSGSEASSKKSAKKRPASLEKTQESTRLPKKRKNTNKISDVRDKTSDTHQDKDNVLDMEIFGHVSSSEDEAEDITQSSVNTTCQESTDACHTMTNGNPVLPQSNGSKNSRNQSKKTDSQTTAELSDSSILHSADEVNRTLGMKEPSSSTVASTSFDISSSEETENHTASPRKKPTRKTTKAKKISAKKMVNTQESIPEQVNDVSSKCSKPKKKCTEKPNAKKSKCAGKPSEATSGTVKEVKGRKSVSPRKKTTSSHSVKTPTKSATKGNNNGKSPSYLTAAERGKIYRNKKRKIVEDLEKEVEDLKTENNILKTTLKGVQNTNTIPIDKNMPSHSNDLQNDEGAAEGKTKNPEQNEEMNLYIQDLKDEIRQYQMEKKKLISVEDMESIVNDMKAQVSQLKNQKKDLEVKEKEQDALVCNLRKEIEQLEKENELETQKKDKSANKHFKEKISALEKKNKELKSKEVELEMFVEDLKTDVKDLNDQKEDISKHNEEMKVMVDKSKEEINSLKKVKEDLVSKEKEMELNLKELRNKLEGLKKQNNEYENNARKADFVIRSLKEELSDLKTEKADCEGNARELESTVNKLQSDIDELTKQKKAQEITLGNMEKEKASFQSSTEQMKLVISGLNSQISKLEEDKATYQSNVNEKECSINKLNEEISHLKTEQGELEEKHKEMDSLIKSLTNENVELMNKVKCKDSSADDEIAAPITKNTDIADGEASILSANEQEVEQLRKDKDEIRKNAEKLDLILQDMKNELDHLKNEKEDSKRNSEEMVTVMQSMKDELFKLKSKEKHKRDDVKGSQVHCLTAEDMSHFVKDLKDEIGYLKGLIINQSELSALAKHVSTFPGFTSSEESSGKRKLDCVSDDTGNENKRQKSGDDGSSVQPAGVCLHVNNGKMSVEFCTTCSKSSRS